MVKLGSDPDHFRGGKGTEECPFVFFIPHCGDVVTGIALESNSPLWNYHFSIVRGGGGVSMPLDLSYPYSCCHSLYFPLIAVLRNDHNVNVYLHLWSDSSSDDSSDFSGNRKKDGTEFGIRLQYMMLKPKHRKSMIEEQRTSWTNTADGKTYFIDSQGVLYRDSS